MPYNFLGFFSAASRPKASLSILFLLIVSSLVISCSVTTPALRSDALRLNQDWPQDRGDLLADPSLSFGRLDNGLRYILKQNQTPKNRVAMHLYVQAGSLMETEEESGIAHYLEHMLFNGSRHFPPGEMVKFFQRIGMQFGPDANAHTGFLQTVYDVVLPSGDSKSLSEGLLVLRDYADGALLTAEETDRERNVILAEMRTRDSSRFRTLKAALNFEMPGLLIGKRFPIGEADVIQTVDHQMLRAFYTAWYRPERMVLIVVGDMNPAEVKHQIEQRFRDLEPQAPVRPQPRLGEMSHKGTKSFFHFEEEAGSARISIEAILQEKKPPDSSANMRRELLQALANDMVQKRLDAAIKREEAAATSAYIASGHFLGELRYSEISAEAKPENWEATLGALERELRQAILFGFTPLEFECAIGDYRAALLQAVKESGTRDTKHLAGAIISSLNDWSVLQSPQQRWEILNPMLESIALEEVNAAFADQWSPDHRLILVTGNAPIHQDKGIAEEMILAAYQDSALVAVNAPARRQAAVFPYLEAPNFSGPIAHKRKVPDIGIEQIGFTNGFNLNLKQTPFKKNQVLVTLSFGGGLASEPSDKPGLAKLTEAVVNDSGFGQMDFFELKEALSGKIAQVQLDIREDMFVLKGEAASEEVQLLFELLHAHLHDQGYREAVRSLAIKRFEQEYLAMARRADGVMRIEAEAFLAGGDHRFGFPSPTQFRFCTIADIKRWYGEQLSNAPLEMAVVGDIDPDAVVSLASRYFGTLPARQYSSSQKQAGPIFPQGQSLRLSVDSQIPKAMVMVAYPTDDFWDIGRTRRLTIMAELFSERLRTHIREKLGAAYSPYAYNRSHRAFDRFGLTRIVVQVDPDQVDLVEREVRKIAQNLASEKLDEDEFKRVLDPTLTYIKDIKQKNKYWLESVLTGVARHPQQLDWCRTFEQDYAAITAQEVAQFSQRYLDNQKAATVIITPHK